MRICASLAPRLAEKSLAAHVSKINCHNTIAPVWRRRRRGRLGQELQIVLTLYPYLLPKQYGRKSGFARDGYSSFLVFNGLAPAHPLSQFGSF